MSPRVRTEDLIDAQTVARILGLSHRNTVSGYMKRYDDFPAPVVDIKASKIRLWLRPDIEAWDRRRKQRRS